MRTLVTSITVIVFALASVGCNDQTAQYADHPALDPASARPEPAKFHPVTEQMQREADALVGKQATSFELPNQDGEARSLAQLTEKGPLVIFFIADDCICCVEGQPQWHRLHSAYRDNVEFVGIINADVNGAKKWAQANQANFDVLADPEMKTIDALHARAGLYTLVIDQDQKIVLQMPGYSQTALKKLGETIARTAGVEPKPLDTRGAPERMTSGCAF